MRGLEFWIAFLVIYSILCIVGTNLSTLEDQCVKSGGQPVWHKSYFIGLGCSKL